MTTSAASKPYLLISLEAGADALEAAAVALFDVGAEGIIEEETPTGLRVKAYFGAKEWPGIKPVLKQRLKAVSRYFPSILLVEESPVADDNWLESWKRFHRPVIIGPLWVGLPSLVGEAPAGLKRLVIDPGLAFGTGGHTTTRLCLEGLVDALAGGQPKELLDVGTGSGVLALAGLVLGVESVVGLDPDPTALETAGRNAELNNLAGRLLLSQQPLASLGRSFNLVVANLTGPLLGELSNELVAATRPGGRLILAGLLVEEIESVLAAFRGRTETDRIRKEGEWAGLILSRPVAEAGEGG